MVEQPVQVISNERDTDAYFRLVLRAPEIARATQPGQFLHLRIPPLRDALLRRPFSIFQANGETVSILYKTIGKGTDMLARMGAGEELSAIGPLGHGFTVPARGGETPLLVAGGYGMAAMYLLAERSPQKGIVFVGGRRRVDILCEAEFRKLGWDVRVATEDGSYGEKGLVTQPLLAEIQNPKSKAESARPAKQIQNPKLFACGPTPMLKAVAKIAEEHKLAAEISMDEHMCCGVGVCLTCVIPVKTASGWEYQRTCTEGPVFDSREVVWEVAK
ncbi:MAG: dihydroorotate dehydrogenase electron transfer subunit [Verrucomicrobia bacterium]|nr:dihydroorotate dehydrogenase electron transfer subunit [Verrucomicrobiota bacterium]